MNKNRKIIYSICFLLASGGFLLPFWPLTVAGVVLAGIVGHPFFAIVVGLLLDLAYGAPIGLTEYLFFPFTLVALLSIGARLAGQRYFLQKNKEEYL